MDLIWVNGNSKNFLTESSVKKLLANTTTHKCYKLLFSTIYVNTPSPIKEFPNTNEATSWSFE